MVSLKLIVPILYGFFHPIFIIINETSILLFAPLHFLYAFYAINTKKAHKAIPYLLFLPFILLLAFLISYYFTTENLLINNSTYIHVFLIGSTIFSMLIMTYTLKIVNKYKTNISNQFASLEKISLNWLKLISLIILIADILVLLLYPVSYIIDFNLLSFISKLGIVLAILIFISGYLVLSQSKIPYTETKDKVRYSTSGLKDNKSKEIEAKLKSLLIDKKIFLREKLSISELAEEINESEAYVSQVINECFGLNFYNLIAKYRIDEAAERIRSKDYANLTLLAIAYDVGFGSKSTFNNAFKKFKGQTPSEFQKAIEN